MLEVGEPGELPLMRELTALKKSKGLQDPSTLTTSSRKSPVLESVSSITNEVNIPLEDRALHDEGGALREHRKIPQAASHGGGSGRKDGSHGGGGGGGRRDGLRGASGRKGSHRSPQLNDFDAMNDFDPRMSWDLGREVFAGMDTASIDHLQRENLRSHLEKLGILGESHGLARQMVGGSSALHNWRTTDHVGHDDGSPFMVEDLKQEASPDMWNWPESWDHGTFKSHPGFFAHQDEDGRMRAMQNTSRLAKGHKLWRQNDQTLSPLVLNSNADMHRFGHAQSFFSLEEPFDDGEEHDVVEWQSGMVSYRKEASSIKVGSRSPRETQQSHRKQAATTANSTRSLQMFSPPVGSVGGQQHHSQSSRPVPWETEFFEYEVEALELPSKKESRRLHQRSKNQKQAKGHLTAPERAGSHLDSMKSIRKKGGAGSEHQSVLQQQFTSAVYPTRSPEVEPLPLLTELEDYNGSDDFGGSSIDGGGRLSISELHGELELEACNNAPDGHNAGRMVRVQDAERLQLAVPDCKELALCEYKPRNLSQKYRPKVFEEVVGQHIVTQALSNAILKEKIAPVYLFQGSRGTGKTSAARIFASALICISSEGKRPCGVCRECISVATGKCSEVREVDAASNNGIERVKALLEETISAPPLSRYKVFIIDECHVLTTETWNALLKILEEPPMNVVFIIITTDPDRLPRTAVSRCQKFPFPKIKDSEIVKRLQTLAALEDLAIDVETLQLIASRSDGSLRDAEITLDQVSLLGQQINSSTVHELVGSASDERILSLLDAALLADTVNTVRRARELVDSGVESLSLMSRLATLITDILAGSFKFTDKQRKGFFRKQALSEEKLERLRMAMKTLSEAEKQLRVSNDRTTWLTAALLQLGPDRTYMFPASCVGTSVTQSPVALDDVGENEAVEFEHTSSGRQTWVDNDANFSQNFSSDFVPLDSKGGHSHGMYVHENAYRTKLIPSQEPFQGKALPNGPSVQTEAVHEPLQGSEMPHFREDPLDESFDDITDEQQRLSPTKLDEIWCSVVERCGSPPLRQLLYASVKLISISISEVDAVIHLEVCHPDHKSSCERSQKIIADLFQSVLGFPVEIKTSLASLPAKVEQFRSAQASVNRDNGAPGNHIRVCPEGEASQGYEWKNQGSVMKSQAPHHSNATESFLAIPHGAPSKENKCFDSVASMWKNNKACADGGDWLGHQATDNMAATGGAQRENVRVIHKARRLSPLMAPASGGMATHTAQGQHQVSHKNVGGDVNSYTQDLDYDDINEPYSEGERDMEKIEMPSPESHEVTTLHDKSRPRHSAYEEPVSTQSYCVDGRHSCEADLQKRKGSHLKMVRRLSMRSHVRSLPRSDPNSPDDRGSSLRVPRFSIKIPQKSKDAQYPGEGSERSGDLEEAAATQKKGKLKGAADSFARFFQGKLTKQGAESSKQ